MPEEVTIYKAWFAWKREGGALTVEAEQATAWGDASYKIIGRPGLAFDCRKIHPRDSVSLSRAAAVDKLRAHLGDERIALRQRLAVADAQIAECDSWSPEP